MGVLWRRRFVAVAALTVIVGGSGAAEAQELRDRDRTLAVSRQIADDLRRARVHYGPFYLLSSIQLADIGYDQDFFMPVADTSSGFRFGLSAPQRLYFTPNRKTFLSAAFTPQWSRFGGLASHNQTGYLARADAQFLLNHLYLDVYATKSDMLHADLGEISSLVTRKNSEIGAAGELKYSSRTSLTYSAAARSQKFPLSSNKFQPDFPVDLLDRNEHNYRTALVHKTFPLTSLLVAAEYAGYTFPNATFKDSTAARDSSTRAAAPPRDSRRATRGSTSSVPTRRTSRARSATSTSITGSPSTGARAAAPRATSPSRCSRATTTTSRAARPSRRSTR